MKLLLDTHALLWWQGGSRRLTAAARKGITDASVVFVSAVSAWEIAIKTALGKLRLPGPLAEAMDANGFTELPIRFTHATVLGTLPAHHSDPFDRMLLAQAMVEDLILVTHDQQLRPYNVPTLWT